MVIEPIVGFLICGALLLFTRFYLEYFHTEAERHPAFEAWIAERPLVAALRVRPGAAVTVVYALRARLGEGELLNPAGGYPWQHYLVGFECRRIGDDLVGLFATQAREKRDRDHRPLLAARLDEAARALVNDVEAVWLHGKLRSPGVGTVADREKMGWSGVVSEQGLELAPMIGQPAWLAPRSEAKAS